MQIFLAFLTNFNTNGTALTLLCMHSVKICLFRLRNRLRFGRCSGQVEIRVRDNHAAYGNINTVKN